MRLWWGVFLLLIVWTGYGYCAGGDDILTTGTGMSTGITVASSDVTTVAAGGRWVLSESGGVQWDDATGVVTITTPAPEEGQYVVYDADGATMEWAAATSSFSASDIDLSDVQHIELSEQLRQQLSTIIKQEVGEMHIDVSLSWEQWFWICVLIIIGAKVAHKITLRTLFRPTKKAVVVAGKATGEAVSHVKKEWKEA